MNSRLRLILLICLLGGLGFAYWKFAIPALERLRRHLPIQDLHSAHLGRISAEFRETHDRAV